MANSLLPAVREHRNLPAVRTSRALAVRTAAIGPSRTRSWSRGQVLGVVAFGALIATPLGVTILSQYPI